MKGCRSASLPGKNSRRPRLLLLDAGGTIAQIWDERAQELKYLENNVPFGYLSDGERAKLDRFAELDYRLATSCRGHSSARRVADWGKLAEYIFGIHHNYDGVVVAHGTATLAYAASLLSFMLADIQKPILLTGAQSPVRGRPTATASDGVENLAGAIQVAAAGTVHEVAIVFGGYVLRGNRSRKVAAYKRDAFRSPNFPPLARIDALGLSYHAHPPRPTPPPLSPLSRFSCDDRVQVVPMNPTVYAKNLRVEEDVKAVMIGGYSAGIVPGALREPLSDLGHRRLVVVYPTAELGWSTASEVLEAAVPLVGDEVVHAYNITFEAALMKTCWVLAQASTTSRQRALMLTNISGEMDGP